MRMWLKARAPGLVPAADISDQRELQRRVSERMGLLHMHRPPALRPPEQRTPPRLASGPPTHPPTPTPPHPPPPTHPAGAGGHFHPGLGGQHARPPRHHQRHRVLRRTHQVSALAWGGPPCSHAALQACAARCCERCSPDVLLIRPACERPFPERGAPMMVQRCQCAQHWTSRLLAASRGSVCTWNPHVPESPTHPTPHTCPRPPSLPCAGGMSTTPSPMCCR